MELGSRREREQRQQLRHRRQKRVTAISPLVKYSLFVFTFFFWLIAGALLGIGIYARVEKGQVNAVVDLLADPAIVLIIVGSLAWILGFFGCVGALRENICLLKTYCYVLLILFVLQLVGAILGFIFSDKVEEQIGTLVETAIEKYRDDIDLQNLIDWTQKEFQCCGGKDGFKDWHQHNRYFNCSEENLSRERCGVPYSCCRPEGEEAVINTMCGYDFAPDVTPTEAVDRIYIRSCIFAVADWARENLFLLGGIAMGLAIPQLVGILLSRVFINQIEDERALANQQAQL
ncbi:PREDICTED: tetraspanin-33-like isoform X1 [Branchiostoma belcheri]|uniref:Tetraspanin n=1 Tax=Branchiostoma belcheri TaxID=7741 RepID=A0A6P5A1D4_BRABE|nr:PREDICTED: tetraspanin-33-like isoform X1 [Branchiostoma belcheri]KAI8486184.1 Tetraspanin-33 [Branchiostoma belcheri]